MLPSWPVLTNIGSSLISLLVDAFNPAQSERYDLYKRAKLRRESLRRIVNHALSQSVPASVVTTINGFTKVFAGEIVEKARTVQAEWAVAHEQAALAQFEEGEEQMEEQEHEKEQDQDQERAAASAPVSGNGENGTQAQAEAEAGAGTGTGTGTATPSTVTTPASGISKGNEIPAANGEGTRRREFKPPPNPHRGQLLPSHIREALRRYKRDSEGGGVGFSGQSMENLGVRGALTWNSGSVGGRRLFR